MKTAKSLVLAVASLIGLSAFAMEPLEVISQRDQDYNFYSAAVNMDQKMVNDGLIKIYSDFNMFNVSGRIVPIADGSPSNPYNMVLTVNGNLYYVDSILNSVDSFKIRRRWKNNPEPGVFIRIEGRRVNPEDGHVGYVQVWIKIATPEGRALPVLKVLEGDYDLAEAPAVFQPASYLPGNPGPILPQPPFE